MFGGVTDDGHQNDADEDIAHSPGLGRVFDSADQEFAHHCREDRGDEQHDDGFCFAPGFDAKSLFERFLAFLSRFADIEVGMGTQAEDQAEDVADEQHDGDFQAQFLFVRCRQVGDEHVEDGRNDQADRRQHQQCCAD